MTESRSALIVATWAYDDEGLTRLKAPGHDAEALSEVLADPDIGGFDVRTVVNQPAHVVNVEVARFFANRRPDELLLLHFSCHGVKDDSGELYFASSDTRLDLLEASAVSAAFVNKVMGRSRSSRVVLLLDCCYAGAFARGMVSRGGPGLDLNERLGGRGRAVITASTALQFAFDGTDLAEGDVDREEPSVFTRALVNGLRSGEADRDLDGMVSLDELYGYMYDEVTAVTPHQTPGKWVFGLEGDLYLARRSTPVSTPSELRSEIVDSMESPVPWERAAVVPELERLLRGSHPGRALAARLALERLADDDSRQVATSAAAALAAHLPAQRSSEENARPAGPNAGALPEQRSTPVAERLAEPGPVPQAVVEPAVEPEPVVERVVERDQPVATGSTAAPTTVLPAVRPASPKASPPRWRTRRAALAAGGVALLLAAGLLAWWLLPDRTSTGSGPVTLADSTVLSSELVGDAWRLVAMDATTGKQATDFPVIQGRVPAVSPDRQWIIYGGGESVIHDSNSLRFELHRVRADGSGDRRWLASSTSCPFATRPTWNPDNADELAVTCLDDAEHSKGIWEVSADGRLGRRLLDSSRVRGAPTWTGDGTVVFAQAPETAEKPTSLWQVRTDQPGAQPTKVDVGEHSNLSDFDPDWSDSGLMFTRSGGFRDPGAIVVRRPDGSTTQAGTKRLFGTWSPDGQAAAWLAPDGHQAYALWTGDGEGHQQQGISGKLGPVAWGSR